MIDLHELEQFVAFADLGTLNRVATRFHISTPSVTRSMQHVEKSFGVPLFVRGKNKIELTETGKMATECARNLLEEFARMVRQVRDFDERRHTVVVRSCAPAPLWELQRELNARHPGLVVSSAVCQNDEVLSAWEDGSCDIAVLPFPASAAHGATSGETTFAARDATRVATHDATHDATRIPGRASAEAPLRAAAKPFMQENLFVCVPRNHELANREKLTWKDINGFNFLLRTELGFWDALCREKMPASKFLVQPDASVFEELVKASSLPCFTTDYVHAGQSYEGRVSIPLAEPEAHVTFYIMQRENGMLHFAQTTERKREHG